MKKIFALILLLIMSSQVLAVVPVMAQNAGAPALDYSGFVNCDGVPKASEGAARGTRCNFVQLFVTLNKMVDWIFYISIPFATAMFAYAGLLLMKGDSGSRSTAKGIFENVGIGFIIMLSAWFLVNQTVKWIVKPQFGATTLIGGQNNKPATPTN